MKTDPFDNSPPKTPLKGEAPAASKAPALSGEDARQLVEHLAVVTKSGMPIAPALRAAAAELPHQRVAAAMSRLASELEMGRSLDSILRNNPRFLPPYMQRLIETGVQSGNLPQVLVQLLEIDRSAVDLRRSVRLAIAYPIVLLLLWTILVALFAGYVLPDLLRIFDEFHTNLPLPTKMLTWISGTGALRVVGFLAAAIPMVIVSFRIVRRPFAWQRLVIDIPLFGPTLLWRGVANWSRLLALLLRQQIPLPEAVRLAANGTSAPVITIGALRAARSVEAGRKLADGLALVRMVPASIVPLVRWGEDHGALPEALDAAAEMFERRVHLRATFLQSVLPPLAFIFIATGTLWLTNAMVLPLVGLIRDLSNW
jgi:type II secretory pathway component PulF